MEKIKILLIEDDQMVNKALSESLKLKGYEVLSSLTAKDGVIKANSCMPKIILLDLNLPDASGEDVLKEFRDNGVLENSSVIILTNKSDGASIKKCLNLGAKDYFIKVNFLFNELDEAINKLIL